MPSTIVSEILDEARGTYLNDPSAVQYTNEKLFSHYKTAYALLECELESNGLQPKNEEELKTIPAGTSEYAPLPVNFVLPRRMQERQAGTSDGFRDMQYRDNLPTINSTAFLEYWTWRVDRIFFVPADTSREVKLFYQGGFPTPVDSNSVVFSGLANQYLSAKVAALAHMFISQSPTLAAVAESIAARELEDLVNKYVKVKQMVVTRRRPYLPFRVR